MFDGDSMISDGTGTILLRGPQFAEELIFADLELGEATEELESAAPLGLSGMTIHRTMISEAGESPSEMISSGDHRADARHSKRYGPRW